MAGADVQRKAFSPMTFHENKPSLHSDSDRDRDTGTDGDIDRDKDSDRDTNYESKF